MHSLAIHLLRRVRVEDRKAGLSPARLSLLSVLVFGGEATLGALAEVEQVTPPTMSRLVSALESEGLVLRQGDPRDGRVVRVRASLRGREVLERARERRLTHLEGVLGHLTPDQLSRVARSLDVLERALGRA